MARAASRCCVDNLRAHYLLGGAQDRVLVQCCAVRLPAGRAAAAPRSVERLAGHAVETTHQVGARRERDFESSLERAPRLPVLLSKLAPGETWEGRTRRSAARLPEFEPGSRGAESGSRTWDGPAERRAAREPGMERLDGPARLRAGAAVSHRARQQCRGLLAPQAWGSGPDAGQCRAWSHRTRRIDAVEAAGERRHVQLAIGVLAERRKPASEGEVARQFDGAVAATT